MTAFLDRFAGELTQQTEAPLDQCCVVLPNRRAGLFLKRYLAGHIHKPLMLPAIFSVEDFILHVSGLQVMDPVELLFQLYQVHCQVEGSEAQPFDDFITWGKDLIRDFNEIDQYLASPRALFTYLSEAKALSVWNPDHRELTPFQLKYIRFYQSLESYYTLLSERLLDSRRVYQGLAYRRVAETIEEVSAHLPWKKVFFAGFNALTIAEQKIISHLFTEGKAVLYWDADAYYLDDPAQEAGKFLRAYRNSSSFGSFRWIGENFRTGKKEIRITGIPKNVGQVKTAGTILSQWEEQMVLSEDTAVVLVDENLLLPLLNSLPASVTDFNITMGYPLKNTPVFDLVESVLVMHENAERFSGLTKKTGWRYYHRDVFRVLNHPYIMGLTTHSEDVRRKTDELTRRNIVLYGAGALHREFSAIDLDFAGHIGIVFTPWENGISDALDCLQRLMEALRDALLPVSQKESHIELEYVYHFTRLINRIRSVHANYPVTMQTRTLRNLIRRLAGLMTLPFYGEPLKGLQIMGMLETRNLDFRNVILLSANEDLLPAGKKSHSFIPLDVRLEFNLPTYRDHDAVFAYHFYRLLQRAERIHLLYNTEPSELGGGEHSRFINQIIHELPVYNPGIRIHSSLASLPPLVHPTGDDIIIQKSGYVLNQLIEMAETGFTPSSLNTYRNCSLQFYFQHAAKIPVPEELQETIDARTMGTVIHEVMKDLYSPCTDQAVTPEIIGRMLQRVDDLTEDCFRRTYPENDTGFGKNLLIVNISKVLIRNFLHWEKDFAADQESQGNLLIINKLEESISARLTIRFRGDTLQVKIKGTPDRIDQLGTTYRIIDYKTGSVRKSDLSLRSWDKLSTDPEAAKSFQVLFYGYLFYTLHPDGDKDLEPGIISFRTPSAGMMTVSLPDKTTLKESMPQVREIIAGLLEDIYDLEKPFHKTEETKNCQYCPFTGICMR
jgi:hypothetical protein